MNVLGSLLVLGAAFALLRKPSTVASKPTDLGELPGLDVTFGGDVAFATIAVPDAPPPGLHTMQAPAKPKAASPMPGVIPFMAPRPIAERRALASRLAEHLYTTAPGREDQSLVAAFQVQEQLRPSGFYGATTALRLARGYGIVPPKPLYWPKTDTKRSKRRYQAELEKLSSRDRQRKEEWDCQGRV
jgi:hypothetical protein